MQIYMIIDNAETVFYINHRNFKSLHRVRPYESVNGITRLCSSLLPDQHLLVMALYLYIKELVNTWEKKMNILTYLQ